MKYFHIVLLVTGVSLVARHHGVWFDIGCGLLGAYAGAIYDLCRESR